MMKKYKFGLIGTSCSGKSTMAHKLVYELRKDGHLCEGVISSDRKHSLDMKLLDTEEYAQIYVILNQALLELERILREDTEILISDRSMIDFFAYYTYCIKNKNKSIYNIIQKLSEEWINTYDILFYLKPLPYKNDNSRPDNKFRMGVEKILEISIKHLSKKYKNIIVIDGEISYREDKILSLVKQYVIKKKKKI